MFPKLCFDNCLNSVRETSSLLVINGVLEQLKGKCIILFLNFISKMAKAASNCIYKSVTVMGFNSITVS